MNAIDTTTAPELDFGRISREIRGLVARRRELIVFLGSAFAGMGIFLQNVLDRKLPDSLAVLERNAFTTFGVALAILSAIVSLRLAKLHAGMIINGIFYQHAIGSNAALLRAMQGKPIPDLVRSSRLNWMGVSTQFFLWTAFLAACCAALVVTAQAAPWFVATIVFAATLGLLIAGFLYFHASAGKFAIAHARRCRVEPMTQEDHEDHLAESLRDCNHDMLTCITFVGLMVFSIFQALTGLGEVKSTVVEISAQALERQGSLLLEGLLVLTAAIGMVVYLRLLVSVGNFSLLIDPSDRPFRLWKLTDSFLGYLLLLVFLGLSVHVCAAPVVASAGLPAGVAWAIDLAAIAIGLLIYAAIMLASGMKSRSSAPPATAPPTPSSTQLSDITVADGPAPINEIETIRIVAPPPGNVGSNQDRGDHGRTA